MTKSSIYGKGEALNLGAVLGINRKGRSPQVQRFEPRAIPDR
jgi:hypothetical protein